MQEDKDTCRCKSKTWAEAILDFVDDRYISEFSEKSGLSITGTKGFTPHFSVQSYFTSLCFLWQRECYSNG